MNGKWSEDNMEGKMKILNCSFVAFWMKHFYHIGGRKEKKRKHMAIEKDINVSTGTEIVAAKNFTNENPPVPEKGMLENLRCMVVEAWKHSDFLCKGHILSALEDDLYNVYSSAKTSKALWIAHEKKYKTEDAYLKNFVFAKFLDYKMVGSKTVGTQVEELQVLIHNLIAKGMVINEAFQVDVVIEKLPPSWRVFKNYLKHKRKEMSLEYLVIRLKIKEDNKLAERKSRGNSTIMGANFIEEAAPNNNKRKKPSGQRKEQNKKKFKGSCYNCEKARHKAPDFGNPKEWWIDFRATRHVCVVKEAFATYAPVGPEEELYMGNTVTTKVEGYGKIFLKMTSVKVLTLNNVLHVPTIRKNLVSTSLLVKNGFKCVFVSDKLHLIY
ncbi:uncharacterized protein LOC132611817 [Lycium barbarum]|uniref:uncharacterized protein LOC132611817 n=1 Tax=Lycium barbarum TaxID=112863 RepID=UPI00293E7821|nr:uncharacterized protein LOC132611817 [Lycium barbarum]